MEAPGTAFAKLEIAALRLLAGPAVVDAAKSWLFRAEWGRPFSRLLHAAMRGRSRWSVGERELFAAFTSKLNTCSYCVGAHGAVASSKLGSDTFESALADWRTAPVREEVRAMLGFLEKMTVAPETLDEADGAALRATGVDRDAALDAIHICWCFNIGNRQADAYDVSVLSPAAFARATRFLLLSGYRV